MLSKDSNDMFRTEVDFLNDFSYKEMSRDDAKKRKRVDENDGDMEDIRPGTTKTGKTKKHRRTKLQILEDDLVLLCDNLKATPNNKHMQELVHATEREVQDIKIKMNKNKYNNKKQLKNDTNSDFSFLDKTNKSTPNSKISKSIANKLVTKAKRNLINSADKRISNKALSDKVSSKSLATFNYSEEDSIIVESVVNSTSQATYQSPQEENTNILTEDSGISKAMNNINNTYYASGSYKNNSTPNSGFQNSEVFTTNNGSFINNHSNISSGNNLSGKSHEPTIHGYNLNKSSYQLNNFHHSNIGQNYQSNISQDHNTNNYNNNNLNMSKNSHNNMNHTTSQQNTNNIQDSDDFVQKNSIIYNGSTSHEVNNETEAILNDFTLLFEGKYISNYRYNYEQLNQEFKTHYGNIATKEIVLVDISYDKEGRQVPKRLLGSVSVLKSVCYLKIILFENDFDKYEVIKNAKDIHRKAFGGIKLTHKLLTLSLHTSIHPSISLDEQDVVKTLKQYGVTTATRIGSSRSCKLTVSDVKSWANICKYGIKIRNRHYVCSYWEFRPRKCKKCFMIGHTENDNHDKCIEKCKKCGDKLHVNQCISQSFSCINCKTIGTHGCENDQICSTYITKKNELNKKFNKILDILHIKPESYNVRINNVTINTNVPAVNEEVVTKSNLIKLIEETGMMNDIRKEIVDIKTDMKNFSAIGDNMRSNMASISSYFEKIDKKLDNINNKDKQMEVSSVETLETPTQTNALHKATIRSGTN